MSSPTIGQQLQYIFSHASIHRYSAYSKNIFNQLHRCHTAAMGMHFYNVMMPIASIYTSNTIAVATGTALIVVD